MSADSEGGSLDREVKEYLMKVKSFLNSLKQEKLNSNNEDTRNELLKFFDDYYKKIQGDDSDDDDGPIYEELGDGGNITFKHEVIEVK